MSLLYITSKLSHIPGIPPLPGGTIIEDTFRGELSNKWSQPVGQTITADHAKIRIVGTGSSKDAARIFHNTGYWLSMLRNYTVQIKFKINSIGANTKGIYVGVDSANNGTVGDFVFSTVALIDFSGTPVLQIICPDRFGVFKTPAQAEVTAGMPSINTSDDYTLTLNLFNQRATATLLNVTAGTSVSVIYDFISDHANSPNRPNIFYYSFGVCASTDATFEFFRSTTTELQNPKFVFMGDSITAGYCGTLFTDCYADVLKQHTSEVIQIMSGGSNNLASIDANLTELRKVNPQIVFLNIGTNPFGDFNYYKRVVKSMQNSGFTVYPLLCPNRGNPSGGGALNEQIATEYPSLYVDIWTTGWNTMSTGNGEMVDALHPTTIGHAKIAAIIKAAKPSLFPL